MKISPPYDNRHRVSETAPQWLNRHDMVNHALARALPFLACVHATFSLMVLLRLRLMGYNDATILTARELIPVIDMLMCVVREWLGNSEYGTGKFREREECQ